jgi:hypothetical protein
MSFLNGVPTERTPIAMLVVALTASSIAGACGAPARKSEPPVVVALADAGPTPRTAPPAPVPAQLPSGAALLASLDLRKLDATDDARRGLFAPFVEIWMQSAQLFGDDAKAGLLRVLGVAADRPLTFAVYGITPAQRAQVDTLLALSREEVPSPDTERALGVIASIGSTVALRVLIPASDRARLTASLDALLTGNNWNKEGEGTYRSTIANGGPDCLLVGGDADTVSVDFALGPSAAAAVDAAREGIRASHVDAPPLQGHSLHAVYSPAALADLGFLAGALAAQGAAANVDPSQRMKIVAQALAVAREAEGMSFHDGAAIFEPIDLTVTEGVKLEAVVSATIAGGFAHPPAALPGDATTFAVVDGTDTYDVDRATLGAWPLPADCASPIAPAEAVGCAFDVGGTPYLAALPHLFVLGALAVTSRHDASASLVERREDTVVPPTVALGSFERLVHQTVTVGYPKNPSSHEVFVGVLPARTPRAAAECVLAPPGSCSGASRLAPEAAVGTEGVRARLVGVGGRFLVVFASAPEALRLRIGARKTRLGQLELDGEGISRDLFAGMLRLPRDLVATLDRRGEAIELRVSER